MEVIIVCISKQHQTSDNVDEGFDTGDPLVHTGTVATLYGPQVVFDSTHA